MGAGGAVFVTYGATLNIIDSSFAGNTAQGSTGFVGGSAFGADLFLGANTTISVSGSNVQTMTNLGGAGKLSDPNISAHANDPNAQGGIFKQGTGTLVVNGVENFYTGSTVINQGTLAFADGASEVGTSSVVVGQNDGDMAILAFGSSANLDLQGFDTQSDTPLIIGQNAGANGTLVIGNGAGSSGAYLGVRQIIGGSGTAAVVFKQELDAESESDVYQFYTTLGGSLSLYQDGPGTTMLNPQNGPNTYTGGTFVNGGTLQVATISALPAGGDVLVNDGTFDISGNGLITLGSVMLTGGLITDSVGGGAIYTSPIFASSGTINVNLRGTGGLTQNGPGVTVLNMQSTYTGATVISAGTLRLGAGSVTSAYSALTIENGATLDLAGYSTAFESVVSVDGNLIDSSSSGTASLTLPASVVTMSGTIGVKINEALGLNQNGPGTTVFAVPNTFSGGINVNDGVLQFGTDNAVAGSSVTIITIAEGASLDFNGYAFNPANSLIYLYGGSILSSTPSSSPPPAFEFLSTTGGFINTALNVLETFYVYGPNPTVVNAPMTTTGGFFETEILGGTLVFGVDEALPFGENIYVESVGTLDIAGKQATGFDVTLDSGLITDSVGGGSLNILSTLYTQSGTISAVVSGSGGLLQGAGSALTVLAADNEYTGLTVVNGGTLALQGESRTSGYVVNSGGTLEIASRGEALPEATVNLDGIMLITGENNTLDITLSGGSLVVAADGLGGGLALINDGEVELGGDVNLSSLSWQKGSSINLVLGAGHLISTQIFQLTEGGLGANTFIFEIGSNVAVGQSFALVTFQSIVGFDVEDFSFSSNWAGFEGDFTITGNALTFTTTAVPEPSSLCLFLLALSLVVRRGCWRRRRRVQSAEGPEEISERQL